MSARPALESAYTLRTDAAEELRLRRQATALREHTAALLEPVKLPPGALAVDLGCGPGGALDLLSELVGPHGQVLGIDIDPRNVASADQRRLASVSVVRAGEADRTCRLVI